MTYSQVGSAFERTVEEGEQRLSRTWPGLLATGTVGGIDVSLGIFALMIVEHETGNPLLGSLAFSVGFIALTLANSELFTENFLVPIAPVIARRASLRQVARLWIGAGATNMVGGWLLTGIALASYPALAETAVELGSRFPQRGVNWETFASAMMGGTVMTLMTWMERSTPSVPAKLLAAIAAAFVLAAGHLLHAIIGALEMFMALHAGAPFGYVDWLGIVAWASLGNIVGGLGLVTMLRFIQVGRAKVAEERNRSGPEPRSAG